MAKKKSSKKIVIRNRKLTECSHKSCDRHIFWNYKTCYKHLSEKTKEQSKKTLKKLLEKNTNLEGLILSYANFTDMDFSRANLSDAFLDHCELQNCNFTDAILTNTYMAGSILEGSDLSRANLDGSVLTHAKMYDVKLLAYSLPEKRQPVNLFHTNFIPKDNDTAPPKINEKIPQQAKSTYMFLKSMYQSEGNRQGANWAAYREQIMERKVLFEDKRYVKWLFSIAYASICGYGEKPLRVIFSTLSFVFLYSVYYYCTNSLIQNDIVINDYFTCLYFSIANLFSYTFNDINVNTHIYTRFVVASEPAIGILHLSLYISTLIKRMESL